jgi:peroxiredoxin family protein
VKTIFRSAVALVAFAAIAFLASGQLTAAEKPWLDVQKCAACAPYLAQPGLMEHANMAFYPVATGMLEVTTVPAEYEAAMKKAQSQCNEIVLQAQRGEKVYLCGMCTDLLKLSEEGAKIDQVDTAAGHILAVTATDPALIQKIHAHVDRTKAEMMKMSEKPKT